MKEMHLTIIIAANHPTMERSFQIVEVENNHLLLLNIHSQVEPAVLTRKEFPKINIDL